MDVSKLNVEGEWLELETENEEFGTLKVLVVPRLYGGLFKMVMDNDMIQYVSSLVVDWNLKNGKQKVECTEENKMKYLSIIAGWGVKDPKHTKKGLAIKNVGTEIIAFAQNLDNFTKNLKPISN